MKYALFIAEKKQMPLLPFLNEENKEWLNFLKYLTEKVEPCEGVSRISEGAYVCHLNNGLHALSLLVEYAKEFHIVSRTLFFDQEIPWVTSS